DIFGEMPVGVLGRTDGSIELWDLAAGQRTASWRGDSNSVTAASFSPDGTRLATGNVKGQVKIWQVSTRENLATFETSEKPGREQPLAKLVFSPDGDNLASASWPSWPAKVMLWDLTSKRRILSLNGPGGGNDTTIAFSPDGTLLAGGSMGRSEVFVWKLPLGELHARLKGHVTGIVQVLFSPDGKTLATGGYDTVKLWNMATEQEIAS